MKYFEILLKVLFLVGAAFLYFNQTISPLYVALFLTICIALGLTLIFNKDQSYGYKLAKREITMRKIEGLFLIIFVAVISLCY